MLSSESSSFFVRLLRFWLFLLIFFIPLSLKYLTKDPFAISWLNVLSLVFIGLGVVAVITGQLKLKAVAHKPLLALLACLLIALAYALLFTHPLRNGIGLWTSRLLQPMLVGYVVYQLVVQRFVRPSDIVRPLFWSLVPLLLLGGMQAIGFIDYRDPGRITASYFYPNTFARYMDIILLVTLPWILFSGQVRKRLLLGIWGLGVVLLLSSQSYNGTVSLFAGLIAFLILLPRSFRLFQRWGLAAMIIIGLMVAINAPKLPKWQTSINDSRLTRLEFWHIAGGVIQDHFWTGIGIKTWEKEYPHLVEKYGPFPPLNWGSVQPHNVFLDSFIKAGLPGFFAITAVLLWPIAEGRQLALLVRERRSEWWLGVSLAAYGVAMLTFGLIDDPLWSDDTMPLLFILFFTLAATLVLAWRRQKEG